MGGGAGCAYVRDDDLAGAGMGLEVQVQGPVLAGTCAHHVPQTGGEWPGEPIPGTLRGLAGHALERRGPDQGRGIIVVFIAWAMANRRCVPGQKIVFNLVRITGK